MLAFHTMDVFTDHPFSGNPLAVVLGADGLATAQMQTIAREFNLSETIFVQHPADPAHSAKVRIFFPTAEIPFAGHPTIGCAILLAEAAMPDGDFETRIVLEEEAGIVPVRVWRKDGAVQAELTAPVTPFAAIEQEGCDFEAALDPELLSAAIGLSASQIGFGTHRPGIWQGGPGFVFIPVSDLQALQAARASEPHWSRLTAHAGLQGAYIYTPGEGCDYQARMYAPTAGVPEDPATGSASAILAAQLLASGVVTPGETHVSLRQGVEMGRPSQISLTVIADAQGLQSVRIAGRAVRISDGRVRLPDLSEA